jgi:hypothetical protein
LMLCTGDSFIAKAMDVVLEFKLAIHTVRVYNPCTQKSLLPRSGIGESCQSGGFPRAEKRILRDWRGAETRWRSVEAEPSSKVALHAILITLTV